MKSGVDDNVSLNNAAQGRRVLLAGRVLERCRHDSCELHGSPGKGEERRGERRGVGEGEEG